MKKQLALATIAAFFAITSVSAQGGFQRKTTEERVKETTEKLAPLGLDKTASDKTTVIFTDFYNAQEKAMQEMRSAGAQPDREAMKTQRDKLEADRDAKLKEVFTADQYKKFKDEVEASLRPQRGNRPQQ